MSLIKQITKCRFQQVCLILTSYNLCCTLTLKRCVVALYTMEYSITSVVRIVSLYVFCLMHSLFLQGVHTSRVHTALLDKLFYTSKYNKLVRPVQNESLPVDVTLQLTLTDIIRIDEMNHQVDLNVWLRQVWKDEYLTWSPSDFGGKDTLVVPADMIWLPDTILYNSVDDEARKTEKSSNAIIYSDGNTRWSQPSTLRFACKMILTAFPFDQQHCTLRFGSWSFDGSLLNLVIPLEGEGEAFDVTSEFHENGEWILLSAKAHREVLNYTFQVNASHPGVTGTFQWPEVYLSLMLQRKYNFYLFTLLIPYFLISGLSSLVFFLQPESGEKMSLAITTLLSLVVFNEYVMNIVPPSADFFPLLSEYFLIMIVWVGMCVVLSSWVLHIYHQDADCSRMRPWLRVLIFVFLSRAVGMCEQEKKNTLSYDDACSDTAAIDDLLGEPRQFSLKNGVRQMVSQDTDDDEEPAAATHCNPSASGGAYCSSSYPLEVEVYKIRKYLQAHKQAGHRKEAQSAYLKEWRKAAKIVDRFLFWLYSGCNIGLAMFFMLKSVDSSGKNLNN